MKRLPRRHFTAHYKAEAVKLVLEQHLSKSQVARQLDISLKSLNNWVWLTDITYVSTDEGFLYLAGVKDAFTCELICWAMSHRMGKDLVIDTLHMAYQRKKSDVGLIHHSDRGSQYCSKAYQNLLKSYRMIASMSRKGNCWDNAPMESFFAALKTECIYQQRLETCKQEKTLIFNYIEILYNQV